MLKKEKTLILFAGIAFLIFPSIVKAAVYNVSTAAQLQNAVSSANAVGGNSEITLADGTYTLSDTLYVNSPGVAIRSQSGDRAKVIIQGDAMSSSASVGNVIRVAGDNFSIENVTLQKCRWHLIQIVGEEDSDNPIIRNVVFRDSFEQMLKITYNQSNPGASSDGGVVENCLFEYSAGVGPQYYIGGVDGHLSKNWIIRGNTFKNIASPSGSVAEFAVHFWSGSGNILVEKNTIVNCDRGIGFGMETRGNTGGIIRNNMIYHAANAGNFDDVGIALAESPGTQVYNNTIFMENDFPWAIEYRFPQTSGVLVANNLTNKPIQARDGASGTVTKNVTNASGSWFVNRASGDLHLISTPASVIDQGQAISGLADDFDGDSRPQGSGIDIGADEYVISETIAPDAPLGLAVK